MNIFIDFALGKIEKVNPAPIYFGNNNVDKITLYFKNVNPEVEWYPTLSALGSDNDTVYPRLSDTSGTGTKTIDGVDYTYYEFTLSSSNGWNLTPGKTLFYVWVNYPNTNGNQCMGTFGCTILATSGYYKIDNIVVNPELRKYLDDNFQAQKDYMDESIDNLMGGYPRYVDTSTNILALTTNEGVAVGTDDGHWYYWNGSQYVDGGLYQAIADQSVTWAKLDPVLKGIINSKVINGENNPNYSESVYTVIKNSNSNESDTEESYGSDIFLSLNRASINSYYGDKESNVKLTKDDINISQVNKDSDDLKTTSIKLEDGVIELSRTEQDLSEDTGKGVSVTLDAESVVINKLDEDGEIVNPIASFEDGYVRLGNPNGYNWLFNDDTLEVRDSQSIRNYNNTASILFDDSELYFSTRDTDTGYTSYTILQPDENKFNFNKNNQNKKLSLTYDRALFEMPIYVNNDKVITSADNVDDLTSSLTTKPLSANQGRVLDQKKIDKASIYNGLDKTTDGFVLDARQGKALKDDINTLYDYVGYATGADGDTAINKLREIFAFLTGASDDETLLSILDTRLALKADLTNTSQIVTVDEVVANAVGQPNAKTSYAYNGIHQQLTNLNNADNYSYVDLDTYGMDLKWQNGFTNFSRMQLQENYAYLYASAEYPQTQIAPKKRYQSNFGVSQYPYINFQYYENDTKIIENIMRMDTLGFQVRVNNNSLEIGKATNKLTYNSNEVLDTANIESQFLNDSEMASLISEVFD